MKITLSQLRKIIEEETSKAQSQLIREAGDDDENAGPPPDVPNSAPYEAKEDDSLDAKIDAFFVKFEQPEDGKQGIGEGVLKDLIKQLLLKEAGDDPKADEQPTADQPQAPLDAERFSSEIARLIDHFSDLFDVPGIVLRRALNYVGKHYDEATAKKVEDTLQSNYSVSLKKHDYDVDAEYQPPPAKGAGPSGGG